MALFNRTKFNIRNISSTVTIPNSPVARLMYYFECVCTLLQMNTSDSPNIHRLKQYNLHGFLTAAQKKELVVLCLILSPDNLLNKCIFVDENLRGSLNEFYEVSAVQNQLLVARSIIVNGQRKRVNKIMICRFAWLQKNFIQPMQTMSFLMRIGAL